MPKEDSIQRAVGIATAAIEAAQAIAAAAGGQMPDYIDTPGPGERSGQPICLDCGCSFGPLPEFAPPREKKPAPSAVPRDHVCKFVVLDVPRSARRLVTP